VAFAPICVAVLATGLSADALRAAQPYTIPPERRSTVKDQSWFMGLSGVALWSTMLCLAALDFDRALS
jgi:hypothetical protein